LNQNPVKESTIPESGLYGDKSYNVRPITKKDGTKPTVAERLRYLEKKFAAMSGNVRNPHAWLDKNQGKCKNATCIGNKGCMEDFSIKEHTICFDDFPKNCIVYDFGIRQQPEFGRYFAQVEGCEVHAFDPTPITLEWIKKSGLDKIPNYHFHPYGAGGYDGQLKLFEYNWGQHSIIRFPPYRKENKLDSPLIYLEQPHVTVPVKPLDVIMKELGHEHITLLKLDVEGSEYMMLEAMFDTVGCPPFDQLSIEWHHFEIEGVYGTAPRINNLMNLLADCGFKQFWTRDYFLVNNDFKKGGFKDLSYQYASFKKYS